MRVRQQFATSNWKHKLGKDFSKIAVLQQEGCGFDSSFSTCYIVISALMSHIPMAPSSPAGLTALTCITSK